MATDSSLSPGLTPEYSTPQAAEASVIDASLRAPLIALTASAVVWLLIASMLGIISSWQLHTPAFFDGCEYVTFGRIQPAQTNAFIFGWGFNAAFAVGLWIMARLSRGALPACGVLLLGTVFWNVGVTAGVSGIILGFSTSIEWLEMPGFVSPLLLIAYALISAWSLVVFRAGRSKQIYASQWYLFAALFWFPWIYSVAEVMLVLSPVRGTVQSVVHAWFAGNLFLLWFGSIGLAAIYYFLPKLLSKPVSNYYLASLSFWWLVIFGSWAGVARLIGGPVPAWVQTVGAAASFMLLVPIVILGMNHYGTLSGRWSALKDSITLRFVACGIVALTLMLLAWVADAIHGIAAITQFTYAVPAQVQLGFYGFFSMVMFGSLYYIVPRILGTEWASAPLAGVHFGASAIGVALLVGSLAIGGYNQGFLMSDATVSFADVTKATLPYLLAASTALVLLAIGQLAFAINFFWTLSRASAPAVCSVKGLLAAELEAAR
ncbi:MAG: cbb3-type cytochrome c oxidase subunit I [Opitutaceae bacterium]|jgi:cytochrome c oxidase cbb3-type subunit 1